MNNTWTRIMLVAGLLTLFPLQGWSYEASALLQDCTLAIKQYDGGVGKAVPADDGAVAAERCRSFSLGVFSVLRSLQVNKESFLVCAPANVKLEQVVRVVTKWLGDNPSKLHLSAEYAASVSLREAFPCQKKSKATSKSIPGKEI